MANNQNPVVRLDRYLSNFATKYKLNQRVGDFLAPPFGVARPTDKFAQFTKGNTFRVYDTAITRGEEAKQVELEHTDGFYSCKRQALATWIDDLDAENMDNSWKIDKVKTELILDGHRLAREYRVLSLAKNPAIVTQYSTPITKWDVAAGTPVSDILNAMDTVFKSSTKIPNAIILSTSTALRAIQTTEWKDFFKRTDLGFPNLFNMLDGLRSLGLEPMIAGTFGINTPQGSVSDPQIEQLLGKDSILFYREQNPTLETRTFMYSPFCKENEVIKRHTFTWRHGYSLEASSVIDELLVDSQCAYLFQNVIS